MSNPDTLPVNNRFSILNDLNDQEQSLDTNNGKPHGNESNQFGVVTTREKESGVGKGALP